MGGEAFLENKQFWPFCRKLCRIELSETGYILQSLQSPEMLLQILKSEQDRKRIKTSAKNVRIWLQNINSAHFVRSDCS